MNKISNQITINGTLLKVSRKVIGVQKTAIRFEMQADGIDLYVGVHGTDDTPGMETCKEGDRVTVVGALKFSVYTSGYELDIEAVQVWQ